MKNKLIMISMAVLLLAVLVAVTMPASAAADNGVAVGVSADAETVDLAVMSSEALIINEAAPAPAPAPTGEAPMWIALGASLVTLAVVSTRRQLTKIISKIWGMLSLSGSGGWPKRALGTGGPNKFILPA